MPRFKFCADIAYTRTEQDTMCVIFQSLLTQRLLPLNEKYQTNST